MSLDTANFVRASSHANSNAPVLWAYRTTDTQATINTASYFDELADVLTVGDTIMAHVDTGGTPNVIIFWVNANDGSVVDVTDGLAVGTTDTD